MFFNFNFNFLKFSCTKSCCNVFYILVNTCLSLILYAVALVARRLLKSPSQFEELSFHEGFKLKKSREQIRSLMS